ncbi:hypothetical protein ACPFL9_17330 [Paenarthrobacter sp. NyZ202]|uniref:hypothetical protein n=1 Tax=Paenarthrobacter sp. NyZ202 TaxID=3402689 RepID=UPI003CEE77D7
MGRFGDFLGTAMHRSTPQTGALPLITQPQSMVVPKLAEIVGGVVAMLREDGRSSLPVVDSRSSAPWPGVYVLGHIAGADDDGGTAFAEVAMDGSGRLALFQPLEVAARGSRLVPVSSSSLEGRYLKQVGEIRPTSERGAFPITLDRTGELMILPLWRPEYTAEVPLRQYLYSLASEAGGVLPPG